MDEKICCIPGCGNNNETSSKNTTLYPFPSDNAVHRERRKIWISAIKQACNFENNWKPGNRTRICSCHFVPNIDTQRNPNLFIPTIFPDMSQFDFSNGHFLDIACQTEANCNGLPKGELILENLTYGFSNRYMEAGKCVRDAEIQVLILIKEEEINECFCKESCDGFCFHCSERLGISFIKTEDETFNDVIEISD